ncbi:hypothetical protein DEGR_23910 [Deinococcus grandis]|nr:hypothetical protein DEGR_23910 [Deinococcus grandis]
MRAVRVRPRRLRAGLVGEAQDLAVEGQAGGQGRAGQGQGALHGLPGAGRGLRGGRVRAAAQAPRGADLTAVQQHPDGFRAVQDAAQAAQAHGAVGGVQDGQFGAFGAAAAHLHGDLGAAHGAALRVQHRHLNLVRAGPVERVGHLGAAAGGAVPERPGDRVPGGVRDAQRDGQRREVVRAGAVAHAEQLGALGPGGLPQREEGQNGQAESHGGHPASLRDPEGRLL